jgi:hypothetical protein
MKTFPAVLGLGLLFTVQAAWGQSASSAPTTAQLIGTWQLVSVTDTVEGKEKVSLRYGSHPVGFLMYEPDGHMCATLGDGDRAAALKSAAKPTDAEKAAYEDSFVAYCGTFKLDAQTSTVYHYPTISLSPEDVGATFPRPFRLEGDKLIIAATQGISAGVQKRVLVWQRAKPGLQ